MNFACEYVYITYEYMYVSTHIHVYNVRMYVCIM